MFRSYLKSVVLCLISIPFIWRVIRATIGRIARGYRRLSRMRERTLAADDRAKLEAIFNQGRVLHGPFRGMAYPPELTKFPVRLGSYEAELEPTIEAMVRRGYDTIVNIGSGFGYYAVGMALRLPSVRVEAYEGSAEETASARRMAEMNHCAPRLHFHGYCTDDELLKISLGDRALVLCDCEGAEWQLFTPEVVKRLRPHDILMETHDMVRIETTREMQRRFSATHDIVEIRSVDDIIKAYEYEYSELASLPLSLRHRVLQEERRGMMRWLWMTAKSRPDDENSN